jgi:photosystem II stability/assembly factor-like uncharacterized protein
MAASLPLPARTQGVEPSQYAGMRWRFVGPLRAGRTKAIVGVPDQPNRFYIGAVNGGVWRTDNAGRTWTPIFDGQSTGSIGALAIAPSDPNVIYVGSGEGLQRPDLSVGNGIYKSTDGGTTWTHLGLRDGQQIAWISVDPTDANRLFVAVLGHPYGPNSERGVYRSLDGGATFKRVLYKDENTGANDVKIDPSNPKVVYATLWAARSAPWEAGPFEIAGSGVFKSTDGGNTWTKLTNGLPPRIWRSELGIAPSDTNVVYAAVDAPTGCAIYRSDDAGDHFSLTSSDDRVCARSGDLLTVNADPKDPHTVYATSTSAYRSTDGGKTFIPFKGAPGGDDYLNIWINPNNPNIIAAGVDQGATISVDHGKTWSSWYNQPTGQMYHVNADDRFPYWVCGGGQDWGSACVASRGNWGQTTERDWHPAGAEEYGYVVPDPLHPGVFFGGKVERFDERTTQSQEVSPNPLRTKPYRVVRTEPIAFDHFDKHLMYFGANQVYTTRDGGKTWKTISPNLPREKYAIPPSIEAFETGDPEKGAHRGVVYALAPSYTKAGTIWAGTDDGLVYVTRDAGGHWQNITPPALTPWSKISQIDASRFDNNTAYVSVNRIRLDDMHPWIYRTHDGGTHWTAITEGLPNQPVNAVRSDEKVPGLLYAATEDGVYTSFDDGAHWQSLQNNLPHTSARDVIVHGNDLVVATHGRGFWILDDVEPLRELARSKGYSSAHLFTPVVAYRLRRNTNTDTPLPPEEPRGTNPPDGAIIDYTLSSPAQRVTITIRDSRGTVVRRYASDDPEPAPVQFDKPSYWERPFERPDASIGMHRFAWNYREASPPSVMVDMPISANYEDTPRVPQGALVVPGRYVVELNVDGKTQSRSFDLRMDPRIEMSKADLQTQYDMAHQTAELLSSTYSAMNDAKHANQAKRVTQFGQLNTRLTFLMDLIDGADAPVTNGTRKSFCALRSESASARGASVARNSLCP